MSFHRVPQILRATVLSSFLCLVFYGQVIGQTVTKSETVAADQKEAPAADAAADTSEQSNTEVLTESADINAAKVAKPASGEPIQIYGWREYVYIAGITEKLPAKLDTGAFTSSIHAEEKELFERDGKKWVRFIVTDSSSKKSEKTRIEAPLVRFAEIKEPGGVSTTREVVRLAFQIGDRKMRAEFTLNNRSNMLAPVLLGRTLLKDLGMIDPGRIHLAEKKVFR